MSRASRAEPRGMTHGRTDMSKLTAAFRHCFEKGRKDTARFAACKDRNGSSKPFNSLLAVIAYHNFFSIFTQI
jgi:hypothetical protein